jgi:proline dehydrogenase
MMFHDISPKTDVSLPHLMGPSPPWHKSADPEKKMQGLQRHKQRLKRIAWKIGTPYAIEPKTGSMAIKTCRILHRHGVFTTIGKFSRDGDKPEQIVSEYNQCSESLQGDGGINRLYLSLKPPALDFNIEHVKTIASAALKNGHGVHFDSHDHCLAEPTLKLLKSLLSRFGPGDQRTGGWQFGLTLPSRWKRSLADARWAVNNGVRVRLVKGEFKAADASDEMDPKKGFLKLIDCLAGSVPEIAIATHDRNLARKAISRSGELGKSIQLELLFGMPATEMIGLAKQMNLPLRFYVAYGDTLLLYGIRHLVTTPRKFLRPNFMDVFHGHQSKLFKVINSL